MPRAAPGQANILFYILARRAHPGTERADSLPREWPIFSGEQGAPSGQLDGGYDPWGRRPLSPKVDIGFYGPTGYIARVAADLEAYIPTGAYHAGVLDQDFAGDPA